jgi:peroxiredoxin
MKPLTIAFLGALLCASLPAQQGAVTPSHTNLKVGDMAPDFTLPATTGDKITLSSFRGKAPVVLAFFPAAFTGGCTKEMLAYQANSAKFEGAATKVF